MAMTINRYSRYAAIISMVRAMIGRCRIGVADPSTAVISSPTGRSTSNSAVQAPAYLPQPAGRGNAQGQHLTQGSRFTLAGDMGAAFTSSKRVISYLDHPSNPGDAETRLHGWRIIHRGVGVSRSGVSFHPKGLADGRLDARIEAGQGQLRLDDVLPEVGCPVRMFGPLIDPLFPDLPLKRQTFRFRSPVGVPSPGADG